MTDYQDKRMGGRIDNWCIELGVMWGEVYGDDLWLEGSDLKTSYVIEVDLVRNIVETRNTIYQLGPMLKGFNYDEWYEERRLAREALEKHNRDTGMFM